MVNSAPFQTDSDFLATETDSICVCLFIIYLLVVFFIHFLVSLICKLLDVYVHVCKEDEKSRTLSVLAISVNESNNYDRQHEGFISIIISNIRPVSKAAHRIKKYKLYIITLCVSE